VSQVVVAFDLWQWAVIVDDTLAIWVLAYWIFLNGFPIYNLRASSTAPVLRWCFFVGLRVHILESAELLSRILDTVVALIVLQQHRAILVGQGRLQ